jgi:hypothetical protein
LEQIIALKFPGLSMRETRCVLGRGDLELRNALRVQIKALEERQTLLSLAIHAIRSADLASDRTRKERGPGTSAD